VLGTDFTRTVRAAQAGDVEAFVRLWRDANPVLVRYLRVVGHDDPYDGACEGWVTVVRGLPDFRGDEAAWWVWLLQCARMRAQDGVLRRAWGSVPAGARGRGLPAGDVDPLEVDDLYGSGAENPRRRGLGDTLSALRSLPLGQGEVLLLRLALGLSVHETGLVVQSDDATVRRLEDRGLERLAVSRELLGWSLDAPPTPAELADERVVLGRYRAMPVTTRRTRVVAIGGLPAADRAARRAAARGRAGRRGETDARGRARSRGVARQSRAAAVTIAAVSASVMSLGGLSAAAYVGALPAPVQDVMHRAIGAPAAGQRPGAGSAAPQAGPTSAHGSATRPAATAAAAPGLCRAWAADKAKGTSRDSSVAFRNLATAAGGAGKVETYCVSVLVTAGPTAGTTTGTPGSGQPSTGATAPGPSATKPVTPNPNSTRTGAPNPNSTRTATPRPKPTRTSTPNSRSTQSGAPTRAGSTAPEGTSDTTAPRSGKADSSAPGTEQGTQQGTEQGTQLRAPRSGATDAVTTR